LDAQVRVTLRRWLRELHEELKLTTVFVTHDQEEALELADRVAVMNNGRVEQVGSPEVIYQQPATPFVCEFIGKVNRFTVRRHGAGLAAGGWKPEDDPWQGRYAEAVAYVRPEQLRLAVPASQPAWEARLRHIYLAGSVAHLELHVESFDQPLEADIASEDLSRLGLQAGMDLRVAPRGAVLFPRDGQGATINHERWIWHARSPVPA
jgi:sulfate transport system ATP-binding protein